jgi:addiction module RelE/StbE family toxin
MYEVFTTRQFEKAYRAFIKIHPELKDKIKEKLKRLMDDPGNPGLKTHKLSGKLSRHRAMSITHSYRVIFIIEGNRIYLTNIGTHDDVYKK